MSNPIRATFITEQHLGLKTFSDNLRQFIDADARIQATWVPVTYQESGHALRRVERVVPQKVAGLVQGWMQVRRGLRQPADVRFFLTHVPAVLGGRRARAHPYVVMTDVTPVQYDSMADGYGQRRQRTGFVNALKARSNRRAFQRASTVMSLSTWTASSVVADYGVPDLRSIILAPGVDLAQWCRPVRTHLETPRILFVGGDFHRKGGDVLVEAFRSLSGVDAELHLITNAEVDVEGNDTVHVHRGLTPNSPELIAHFHAADVFVLPSRAETFGQVVVEAMASGLPCVVSDVGGMPDIIDSGRCGLVVPSGDVGALAQAMRTLLDDRVLRVRLGDAARSRAEQRYDAKINSGQVVNWLIEAANGA